MTRRPLGLARWRGNAVHGRRRQARALPTCTAARAADRGPGSTTSAGTVQYGNIADNDAANAYPIGPVRRDVAQTRFVTEITRRTQRKADGVGPSVLINKRKKLIKITPLIGGHCRFVVAAAAAVAVITAKRARGPKSVTVFFV